MTALLFVYGTLKRGQRYHHLIRGQEFLGAAQTAPRYRLYDFGPYPLLVEDPEHGRAVQGEVWRVEEAVLHRLDEWEGVPHLYSRKAIALEQGDELVWGYLFNGDVADYPDCGGQWPASR